MASDRLCGVAAVFSVYSIHCLFSIKAAHIDSVCSYFLLLRLLSVPLVRFI